MKVKFGSIITEGRGKLGGHVASRNTFGAYFRTRVTPINRQSSAQQNVRAIFGSISQSWRNLSNSSRDAWRNAISNWTKTDVFGDVQRPTGFSLFQRLNMIRVINGLSLLNNPPAPGIMPPVIVTDYTVIDPSTGVSQLTVSSVSPVPTEGNYMLDVWATPPLSRGINFVESEYRRLGTNVIPDLEGVEPNLSGSFEPADLYIPVFGNFDPSQDSMKVFFRVRVINLDNGNTGPFSSVSTTLSFS